MLLLTLVLSNLKLNINKFLLKLKKIKIYFKIMTSFNSIFFYIYYK